MKIKTLISATRRRLTWPVAEVTGPEVEPLRITSDHIKKTHTIYLPDHDVREIEYLHELGHAWLCENINPMFGTQYFARSVTPAQLAEIQPAAQGASDWICDQWLFEQAPAAEKAEIKESLDLICRRLKQNPSGSPEIFCMVVLIFAQTEKYLRKTILLSDPLKSAVTALVAINPARPNIKKLAAAVNTLLAGYSSLRVHHTIDAENLDCWEVSQDE